MFSNGLLSVFDASSVYNNIDFLLLYWVFRTLNYHPPGGDILALLLMLRIACCMSLESLFVF